RRLETRRRAEGQREISASLLSASPRLSSPSPLLSLPPSPHRVIASSPSRLIAQSPHRPAPSPPVHPPPSYAIHSATDDQTTEGVALTKIDRVLAALRGEPVDRLPFSFWYHFGLQHRPGKVHAEAELDFYRFYQPDFLKVMSDYPYPLPKGLDVVDT